MSEEDIVQRIATGVYPYVDWAARDCLAMLGACESPIERILGASFLLCARLGTLKFKVCGHLEQEKYAKEFTCLIVPQYPWNGYRIDFAFVMPDFKNGLTFVECDGHQFHERTPDQAARDRSKDRKAQEAGIPILRFTGREIYRDPVACVDQIGKFLTRGADGPNSQHQA